MTGGGFSTAWTRYQYAIRKNNRISFGKILLVHHEKDILSKEHTDETQKESCEHEKQRNRYFRTRMSADRPDYSMYVHIEKRVRRGR